jgi:hypothetical protein
VARREGTYSALPAWGCNDVVRATAHALTGNVAQGEARVDLVDLFLERRANNVLLEQKRNGVLEVSMVPRLVADSAGSLARAASLTQELFVDVLEGGAHEKLEVFREVAECDFAEAERVNGFLHQKREVAVDERMH